MVRKATKEADIKFTWKLKKGIAAQRKSNDGTISQRLPILKHK
jgi:hypothetical protein